MTGNGAGNTPALDARTRSCTIIIDGRGNLIPLGAREDAWLQTPSPQCTVCIRPSDLTPFSGPLARMSGVVIAIVYRVRHAARFDWLAAGSEGKDRDKDGCSAMPGTKVARMLATGCQIDEVTLLGRRLFC